MQPKPKPATSAKSLQLQLKPGLKKSAPTKTQKMIKAKRVKKPKAATKPAVKTMVKALPNILEQRHRQHLHQCLLCPKYFQSVRILARHLQTCTVGTSAFVCKTCSASFNDKEKLDQHLQIHGKYCLQLVLGFLSTNFE